MATTYKTFLGNDVTTTRTLLHEAIPLTGTIVSGTYKSDGNIKNYSHGMFQSVYDYPYLSSSANHIFDIAVGYSEQSHLSGNHDPLVQNAKKINIYNQMAQVLVGHDVTGGIKRFDADGRFDQGKTMDEVFFVNFSRLLVKDEIKKGSFSLRLFAASGNAGNGPFSARRTLADVGAASSYKVNSPAGEYAILYTGSSGDAIMPDGRSGYGLLYYQAGIAVITASIFLGEFSDRRQMGQGHPPQGGSKGYGINHGSGSRGDPGINAFLTGASITGACDAFRNRWRDLDFNNTTELNSTIYFCRANHNDFNYSSNPSYLNESKIRVKGQSLDEPRTYITTVGLYSADNELLAVAKVSEPLEKKPDTELTLRVRLDY
jgi:hypothetical protein